MAIVYRQVFPVVIANLVSVSFGMMLGWPSMAYPDLLNLEKSPIPVTLDETSLIAGFLMEGNSVGCLFATITLIPSKPAICLCYLLQIIGWLAMYLSKDIFWFLASRSSIGFANGFAWGQIKRYVSETCEPDTAAVIANYSPVSMSIGVLLMHILGDFVGFRGMAFYAAFVPICGLIIFILTPKNKLEVPNTTKINNVIITQEKTDLGKDLTTVEKNEMWGPIQTLKDWDSFKLILVIFLLVFVQQYGGGPANIVYSTIIFIATHNPYPKFCSTIYTLGNVINTLIALRFAASFNRKVNLLVSTAACIVVLILTSLYFHLRQELQDINEYFVWTPVFLLLLYNFFHTFSYGALPLLIISENMKKPASVIASKFWIIHFSMSAVISTKIFQVLFGRYNMATGYFFFICVLAAGFFALIFMEDYAPRKKLEIMKAEEGCDNKGYENTERIRF